eukprot:TRINITY_DN3747_c0_g4_i3.p1 TRINITY_DN3747_c0_g4~~TRINITY_DN3747_c0_g4_i3.p1  ORF type:complete len:204 (+),score=4.33 TRINITY_DN3747_c0_g4_i3:142-753(+)
MWGCAIFSRFDLDQSSYLRLDHIDKYPRSALGAVVHAPVGPVCVYSVHLEVCCGLQHRVEQFNQIVSHWSQNYCQFSSPDSNLGTVICGDFNTIGQGLVRFSPFHCTDKHRWRLGLTETEAGFWKQNVLTQPPLSKHQFSDPFDANDVTLLSEMSFAGFPLVAAKLDWIMIKNLVCGKKMVQTRLPNNGNQSDHFWLYVELNL